jgi:hypothetical protein
MFEKKEPNPYSPHFGEYIADFTSTHKEVSAILFRTNAGAKAYIYFSKRKDLLNLKDRFLGEILDYLQNNDYPKLSYISILDNKQWNKFRSEGGVRIENTVLPKLRKS